jgi:hypothetical protein
MAIFIVDQNKHSVTIHHDDCRLLSGKQPEAPGSDENLAQQNPAMFFEQDLNLKKITALMNGSFWILDLCADCFQ